MHGASGSATISNNADNRIITCGSGTNLKGESNLTFDGYNLVWGSYGYLKSLTDRLMIESGGRFEVDTSNGGRI